MTEPTPPDDPDFDRWWRFVSPLLDEALALAPAQRADWFAELRQREPALATRVHGLLGDLDALSQAQFLSQDVAPSLHANVLTTVGMTGARVGAYSLVELLGQGGMGTVWRGERADGRFAGQAAIKLLNIARLGWTDDAQFVREASVLAQLQHPNIAHLSDAGVVPGGPPYLVLEYVEGERIDRYCEQQQLSINERVALFLEVLAAVVHAHSRLVVHCDLKPANILVTAQGSVKLLDFGIAALLTAARQEQIAPDAGAAVHQQVGGAVRGMTPQYAAPEQLRDEAVTTATDVYALGMVLFVLLVGRHPSSVATGTAQDASTTTTTAAMPAPLLSASTNSSARRRVLRGDLDAIVAKALQHEPTQRYLSADAFAQDLRRFLAIQPVLAHGDSLGYRVRKFVRRHRAGVIGASLATVALIVVASFALAQMFEARTQRDEAQAQTKRADGFADVVTSLLSQSGPGGQPLTAEALLDRAEQEMTQTYKDDPATLVHMLMRISGRFYDLRNASKEYAAELRAEAIARRTGDRLLLLDVQCNTVETEVNMDMLDAARKRMREADALLATLPNVDAGVRSDCLRNAGELAWRRGAQAEALRDYDEGLAVLRAAGRIKGNRYGGLLSTRAAREENLVAAHGLWLELEALDARFGRANSVAGFLAKSSVAQSFFDLGEVRKARALFEATTPQLTATPMGRPPVLVPLWTYGEILLRSGDYSRAKMAFQRVLKDSDKDDSASLLVATLSMGRLLVRTGDTDGAQKVLTAVRAMLRARAPNDASHELAATRLAVELNLARHELADATREVDAGIARVRGIELSRNSYLAPLLLLRARVQMAQQQPNEAAVSAREAVRCFTVNALDPRQSADVGEAQLVLAQALAAAAHVAEAFRAAAAAVTPLTNGLGEQHVLTRSAIALAARAAN